MTNSKGKEGKRKEKRRKKYKKREREDQIVVFIDKYFTEEFFTINYFALPGFCSSINMIFLVVLLYKKSVKL